MSNSSLEKGETAQMQPHHEDMLNRVRTAGSVTITGEMFEQMFLQPKNRVSGELRTTFGNPTGIGESSGFSRISIY